MSVRVLVYLPIALPSQHESQASFSHNGFLIPSLRLVQHFAKGNPYFSDRVLSKKFAVDTEDKPEAENGPGAKPNPLLIEMSKKYELDYPVKSTPVTIQWASDEHNLVAKKPSMTMEAIDSEEDQVDVTDAFGSFFNFFSFEEDRYELHSSLLELHSRALE